MSGSNPTRCFTCGGPAADPRVLNRLSDGRVCPACVERALEALPSLLPRVSEQQPQNSSRLSVVRDVRPEDDLSWVSGDEPDPA